MFVEIIREYNDSELGELVPVGRTMEVEDKRGYKLIQYRVAKKVESNGQKPRGNSRGGTYGAEIGTDTK